MLGRLTAVGDAVELSVDACQVYMQTQGHGGIFTTSALDPPHMSLSEQLTHCRECPRRQFRWNTRGPTCSEVRRARQPSGATLSTYHAGKAEVVEEEAAGEADPDLRDASRRHELAGEQGVRVGHGGVD